MGFYGVVSMKSLLFALTGGMLADEASKGGSTCSLTTMNGLPCSSLMTEAI